MSATVWANLSLFDLGDLRFGNLQRTILSVPRALADSREPFVLTAGEFAYTLDTVPIVERKEEALDGRFVTQTLVLQAHG